MNAEIQLGRNEVERLQAFVRPTLVLAVLLAAGLNAFGLAAPDRGSAWAGLTVWVTVAALVRAQGLLRSGRVADAALLVVLGTSFPCLTGVFGVPETCVAALLGGVWALAFGVSYLDGRALAIALVTGAAVLLLNLILAATLIDSDLPHGAGAYLLVGAALSPGGALAVILLQLRHLRSDDRSSRSQAEEADRVKTEFLASMSHELRTPMSAVIGLADLLRDSPLDDAQRSYVETIQSSGEHLLGLINEILDYSKLTAGRLTVTASPFDPVACAEEAVGLVAPLARTKGLRVTLLTDPAVGTLTADEHRVRQILLNLLGNAVKFTRVGEVTVRLAADDGDLLIDVTDTGPGFADGAAATLFEPFGQLPPDGGRPEGTGLGLPISRQLAELMGGTLTGAPDVDGGARFTVRLPGLELRTADAPGPLSGTAVTVRHPHAPTQQALVLAVERLGGTVAAEADVRLVDHPGTPARPDTVVLVDDPAELTRHPRALQLPFTHETLTAAVTARPRAAVPAAPLDSGLAGLRVLVADDHPINRHVLNALLGAHGITADVVADGDAALAAVDARPYDLVVLDLHMPTLGGDAAARAIRSGLAPDVQPWIIVTSASVLDEDRARALAAGADVFLPKPITREGLTRALLQGSRRGGPGAHRHGRAAG